MDTEVGSQTLPIITELAAFRDEYLDSLPDRYLAMRATGERIGMYAKHRLLDISF